jgi:hypothetical protein
MPFRILSCFAVLALVALTAAPARAATPTLAGSFSDWFVYNTGTGKDRVCYALSQPKDAQPSTARRDPIFFLISTWPGRSVENEPSVVPGYAYKEGAKVQVRVGSDKFDFFTQNAGSDGGAWMENGADEKRLITAMRAGTNMIVTGTSKRGTMTTDTYSLAGIAAALDKLTQVCK